MAWADEIVKTSLTLVPYLRLDGIPRWFFTRLPGSSWAAPAGVTFSDGLDMPDAIRSSVDPIEWKGSDGHMTFVLTDLSTPSKTYGISDLFTSAARARADATAWSSIVSADIAANSALITLAHNVGIPGLAFDMYVGLETIRLDTLAAGTTYNVTRARFPAVGVGLARHHVALDGGNSGLLLGSTVPSAWFNRVVALYFTWIDENGRTGAQADARLRWTGRIKAVRYLGNHRWSLDCAPITDDLDREIMVGAQAETRMSHGIEMRGLDVLDRRIVVQPFDTTGIRMTPINVDVSANYYPTIHSLVSEIEIRLALALSPATHGYVSPHLVVNETIFGDTLPRIRWDWVAPSGVPPPPVADRVVLLCSRILTQILGWEGTMSGGRGRIEISIYDIFAQGVYSPLPPLRTYWTRNADRLRLDSVAGFTTTSTGDGGNPAVRIGDAMILRYSSIVAPSLVLPPYAPDDPTSTVIGELDVAIRWGDDAERLSVRQVYLMPRSHGTAPDRLLPAHLLRLMTSTGGGNNGAWDDLPVGYGLGIPVDLVDVASFEDLRDFAAIAQERQWYTEKPTPLREIVDAETAVMGFTVVMNASGQISARRIYSRLAGASTVTLNETNKFEVSERSTWEMSGASVVNAGMLEFNIDPLRRWEPSKLTMGNAVSRAMYGEGRGADLRHPGLFDFVAGWVRDMIAPAITTRLAAHSYPQQRVTRSISRDLFTRLLPGDVVLLTDSDLPDVETGGRGVTARAFRVLEVEENIREATGRVTLARAAEVPSSFDAPLCPSARVTAAAGAVLTLAANDYSVAPATDRDSFLLNDVVLFFSGEDADPTAPTTHFTTISAIGPGANQITVAVALPAGLPPATEPVFMTFASHQTSGANPVLAAQTSRGTWTAGLDGIINNLATWPAHLYTE